MLGIGFFQTTIIYVLRLRWSYVTTASTLIVRKRSQRIRIRHQHLPKPRPRSDRSGQAAHSSIFGR
jgi:hypothetical protein